MSSLYVRITQQPIVSGLIQSSDNTTNGDTPLFSAKSAGIDACQEEPTTESHLVARRHQ